MRVLSGPGSPRIPGAAGLYLRAGNKSAGLRPARPLKLQPARLAGKSSLHFLPLQQNPRLRLHGLRKQSFFFFFFPPGCKNSGFSQRRDVRPGAKPPTPHPEPAPRRVGEPFPPRPGGSTDGARGRAGGSRRLLGSDPGGAGAGRGKRGTPLVADHPGPERSQKQPTASTPTRAHALVPRARVQT